MNREYKFKVWLKKEKKMVERRFEFIDFEDDEETEFLCYCDELEVIGNIYKNKELLENE